MRVEKEDFEWNICFLLWIRNNVSNIYLSESLLSFEGPFCEWETNICCGLVPWTKVVPLRDFIGALQKLVGSRFTSLREVLHEGMLSKTCWFRVHFLPDSFHAFINTISMSSHGSSWAMWKCLTISEWRSILRTHLKCCIAWNEVLFHNLTNIIGSAWYTILLRIKRGIEAYICWITRLLDTCRFGDSL